MIYSRTTEYALNALVFLASQAPSARHGVQEMADYLQIPSHFLGKIMQNLRQGEFVQASRGRDGGYRLAAPAEAITLYDVVATLEDLQQYETCVFGIKECRSTLRCALICDWNDIKNQITDFLQTHSLADLVAVHPFWIEDTRPRHKPAE